MLRLSLIRNSDWDEAARVRLAADSKQQQQQTTSSSSSHHHSRTSSNPQQPQQQQQQAPSLQGISSKTEWFDTISHSWAVEAVPRAGGSNSRFEDASSTGIAHGTAANSSSAAPPATTPFRSSVSMRGDNNNNNNNEGGNNSNSNTVVGGKYTGVCLGSHFTQDMCANPVGSLPMQALKRMRNSGSSPVSVICNVSMIINQNTSGTVTMRDLTAQLVPEEITAELARFHGFTVHQPGTPQMPPVSVLETSEVACHALQLPSQEFQFIRCGAEAYGGSHISSSSQRNDGGGGSSSSRPGTPHHQRSGSSSGVNNTPYVRGDSQIVRLAFGQRQADAAMLEAVIESLAESSAFYNAIGRTSVVFSLFDEVTQAAAQIWFVSDAQLPFFGSSQLFSPGLWSSSVSPSTTSAASLMQHALAVDNVLFATSMLLAQGEHFDRILHFSISAAMAAREALLLVVSSDQQQQAGNTNNTNSRSNSTTNGGGDPTALNARRSQLLQMRAQHEQALSDLQHRIATSGTASEKLAAERQYQRLLMGELELLERRVEEVRQLTDQERQITEEVEVKQKAAQQRLNELEEQKKNLVAEHRALTEEVRSTGQVGESITTQLSLLEQRLAVASGAIVNYRAAAEAKQRAAVNNSSSSTSASLDKTRDATSKHELAIADAQRHFSEVQQQVTNEARESEELHQQEIRSLEHEIAAMQQQNDQCGSKLGEMRAQMAANSQLQQNLEKEYNGIREALNSLLQEAPELAAAQPGSVLDERRDKLTRTVAENKQQISELKIKLEEVRHKRESVEEQVLASERLLQRSLATVQLRIPPQLEAQRENMCEEEEHSRRALELGNDSARYELQNSFYLSLFEHLHWQNSRRHRNRHEEMKLELAVVEEQASQTAEKLNQARAASDVFAKRMDECVKEQARLRDEHQRTVAELQRQLLVAESEPIEELVKNESRQLLQRIKTTSAEIELIQGALMKAPGLRTSSSSGIGSALLGAGSGGSAASIIAAAMSSSSSTFAAHRSLRAAAPVASEIRYRLKLLRRDSHRRSRAENAKAVELEQRLENRRRELGEKATIISTMRTSVSELHEQLQLRTRQIEERQRELDMLRQRDESLVYDLEEELEFAKEISNRHRNENRMQLLRVTQMVSEQENDLSRCRHEVAKLERARNDIVRRMSESNEQTLLMELEHENQKRDELRQQLAEAGIASSPPGGAGGRDGSIGGGSSWNFNNDDEDRALTDDDYYNEDDDHSRHYSVAASSRYVASSRRGRIV